MLNELKRSVFFETLQTFVITALIYVIINLFLFQPNRVDGMSMYPTLHNKDRIITSKIIYRLESPTKGDIVVFNPPDHMKGEYIKRIIAQPGDKIMLSKGQVYLNDAVLEEKYLSAGMVTAEKKFLREDKPYTLKSDEYIVFGDNRTFSSDSRDWGPIVRQDIIGKAWAQYWPFSKRGLIQK